MDCRDIREKLDDYLEGELSPEEKGLVEEHLGACQECTLSLSELQKTVQHVRSLEEVEPPPWLTKKVMEEIRSGEEEPSRFLHKLFYPLYIKLPIEAAAAVLVAVFAVYVFKVMPPEMRSAKTPVEEVVPQVVSGENGASQKERVYRREPLRTEKRTKKQHESVSEEKEMLPVTPPLEKEDKSGFKVMQQTPSAKESGTRDESVSEQQSSPPAKQELPGPLAGLAARNKAAPGRPSAAPQGKALVEKKREIIRLTVKVQDIKTADKEIEKVIASLGGRITKRESVEGKNVFVAELASRKSSELISALRRIGEVEENWTVSRDSEGVIQVRIEVVK